MKTMSTIHNLLSGKIHGINRIVRKVKRVIDFIPIVFKGDDYDYGHTIDLLTYQLERQATYIDNSKYHVNAPYYANRIRLAIKLLKISSTEKYTEDVYESFEKLYGQSNIDWIEMDQGFELRTSWPGAADSQENELINEQFTEKLQESYFMNDKAHHLAWKIIDRDIKLWWV